MKNLYLLVLALLMSSIASAQKIYGINFSDDTMYYNAAIAVWEDGTGVMRVSYTSDCKTYLVEQTISYEVTADGTRIIGSNPIDPVTNKPKEQYSADSFEITKSPKGELTCKHIDSNSSKPCSFFSVLGYRNRQAFLGQFRMELEPEEK